ncbi:hypothetical protein DL96DRAFT_215445 [Flagelloscypha sp. PMI_526]|nr:hypothetical protein DL96DRAFT_215445 [Flagelloscypha sp. PMI_526]
MSDSNVSHPLQGACGQSYSLHLANLPLFYLSIMVFSDLASRGFCITLPHSYFVGEVRQLVVYLLCTYNINFSHSIIASLLTQ